MDGDTSKSSHIRYLIVRGAAAAERAAQALVEGEHHHCSGFKLKVWPPRHLSRKKAPQSRHWGP